MATNQFHAMQLSSLDVKRVTGLFNCFNFLFPHEYPSETIGVFAFVLRKSVGEINYSDIMSEISVSNQLEDFIQNTITLLEAKRAKLTPIPASIAKCLVLNGLIESILENPLAFKTAFDQSVVYMKKQMTDHQANQLITYPDDFRQRESDFYKCRNSVNLRRLSFFNLNELPSPSLIQLQNRTAEHLSYLVDSKMRYEPAFQETGVEEVKKIMTTSFLIINQPHQGVNPVIIAENKKKTLYTAKVDVTILSLLHDFIQSHPGVIKLSDITLNLQPISNEYELESPRKLSWEVRQLQINPQERPYNVLCATLSEITIKPKSNKQKSIHFIEQFHTLNFTITFNLNLLDQQTPSSCQFSIDSSKFKIVSHGDQVSHSVASIILDDIQQYSKSPQSAVNTISKFLFRYFVHRTGVESTSDLKQFIIDQLKKAAEAKPTCIKLDEIYLDWVFLFVNQVEFMAKNPILCMWHATGLFLGPCDSEQVKVCLYESTTSDLPTIALRFNSILRDQTMRERADSQKTKKSPPCSIRIDLYNARTKNFQNHTFDSSKLQTDILNFVSTASEDGTSSIQVLSTIRNQNTQATWKSYTDFRRYDHETLTRIYKPTGYSPIINLKLHITDRNENLPQYTGTLQLRNDDDVFEYVRHNPDLLNRIIQELSPTLSEIYPIESIDNPGTWFDEFI